VKRVITVLLGVLLIVAALGAVVFAGLAFTESGTRLIAAQLERLMPIRISGLHGTLWRAFTVRRLAVELDDRVIEVADLAVDLSLASVLFGDRLELHAVHARAVEVVERESAHSAEPSARLRLPYLPVAIELEQLEIERLEIPGTPVVTVRGAASWTTRGLAIRTLSLAGEMLAVSLEGELGAGLQPTLEARVTWQLPGDGWEGHGTFEGPVDRVAVVHSVTGPYAFDLAGTVNLELPARSAVAVDFTVNDLAGNGYALVDITGRVTGGMAEFQLEARALADVGRGEPFMVAANVRGPAVGPYAVGVNAEPFGGLVAASGWAQIEGAPALALEGQVRAVELGALLEGRQGRVSADVAVGYRNDTVTVTIAELSGTIGDRAVAGNAHLQGTRTPGIGRRRQSSDRPRSLGGWLGRRCRNARSARSCAAGDRRAGQPRRTGRSGRAVAGTVWNHQRAFGSL